MVTLAMVVSLLGWDQADAMSLRQANVITDLVFESALIMISTSSRHYFMRKYTLRRLVPLLAHRGAPIGPGRYKTSLQRRRTTGHHHESIVLDYLPGPC